MTDEHTAQHTKVVAFYSCTEGSGRSCAVANISLILAAWGFRVLIVDLHLAAPSLHRYLASFLPRTAARHDTEPIRLTCRFDKPDGSLDFLGPTSDRVDDPASFTPSRADLISPAYDYVLVDTPPGAESVPLISKLADGVVLGYIVNWNIISKTAQHAQDIRDGERGSAIQILPLPMKVHRDASSATSRALVAAQLQFSWLLGDMPEARQGKYWTSIGIPFEPDFSIDEGLALLDDPSEQRNRLVRAYTELAAELSPSSPPAVAGSVVPESLSQYRAARRAATEGSAAVTVLHAPADRYWGEWLVGELRDMGLTAIRRRIDQEPPANAQSGSELLVVSDGLRKLPGLDEHMSAVLSPAPSPDSQAQLGVSIDGTQLPPGQFPALAPVSLAGKNADQTDQELATFYKLPRSAAAERRHRARYPAAKENPAANLPVRNDACYDRDDEIDAIRDHFTSGAVPVPLTLTGPPGIGKSRLALEYAYRFTGYYDLVFLIRADSEHAVRSDLRELAVSFPPARPAGDAELSVLRHLHSSPGAPERWLLIYDGAESAETLSGLLPDPRHGHVLLTGRTLAADSSAELSVGALSQDAATAMLSGLVPGVLPAEAARLADVLDRVPLAIRLAAGWLTVMVRQLVRDGIGQATVVSNAAQELGSELTARLASADAADDPVQAMVELLLSLLQSDPHAKAASLLLETCALLAPSGMSGRLFRSADMLRQLSEADEDITDLVVLNNVRRTLEVHGFTPQGLATQEPLRLHPRVQEILRGRMSPEERDRRSLSVTRMLAASVPVDIDDEVIRHASAYAELLLHVEPSGALLQMDDTVRRWLVGQVRFLWQIETMNAWRTAASLAERLAGHWAATAQDKDEDKLLLRLRAQLGNVYRSMCDFGKARVIDQDVLHKHRKVLGVDHVRTLMTARGYGADLRLTGEFEKSLNVDQATWRACSNTLGDDHLFTISASTNMALGELAAGYPQIALERQQADVARCDLIRSVRPRMKPVVLFNIGTLQRELGDYEESRTTLADAKTEFSTLVDRGRLAPTTWVVLRTAAGLAITERRLGVPNLNATQAILDTCRDAFGDLYPDVLALDLSLAGDLHALGHHSEAIAQADRARDGYAAVFGEAHPFTRICEVNLSSYALAAGQTAKADRTSEAALAALSRELIQGHLWVQAAKMARANVLAATGRPEEALRMERAAHEEYQRQLRQGSRLTAAVAANIRNTQELLTQAGRVPTPEEGMRKRNIIELDTPPY